MAMPAKASGAAAGEQRWATPVPESVPKVRAIMTRIYGDSGKPKPYSEYKGRYLWTDAHGVCNYVALARETGDVAYLERAEALVADVHDTLGRDRGGNPLGTPDAPLSGGLRIGKVAPEGDPDGDGVYFHYCTKWMVALNRMALACGDLHYNDLAIQLAKAVHRHFVWATPGGSLHMYWKMSIDMRRPAVMSEGNLDPFDGLATYKLLQEHAPHAPHALTNEISDLEGMVRRKTLGFRSGDALDLGEALQVAAWHPAEPWARVLTDRGFGTLEALWQHGAFEERDSRRLAFREFGTTIGVQVNPAAPAVWRERVAQLHAHWGDARRLYARDSDITPVMFATSLLPGAFSRSYDKLPPMQRGGAGGAAREE